MSAATASPGALPTRSRIENWDITHLDDAAARWRTSVVESEELFDHHRQNVAAPGGTDWDGAAKDAALDRVTRDTSVVRATNDTVRVAAELATAGRLTCGRPSATHWRQSARPRPTDSESATTCA